MGKEATHPGTAGKLAAIRLDGRNGARDLRLVRVLTHFMPREIMPTVSHACFHLFSMFFAMLSPCDVLAVHEHQRLQETIHAKAARMALRCAFFEVHLGFSGRF